MCILPDCCFILLQVMVYGRNNCASDSVCPLGEITISDCRRMENDTSGLSGNP